MKISITISLLLVILFSNPGFSQDEPLPVPKTAPKDEVFCKLIYQFVSESRINYKNILTDPISVEGNWFYGASKIALPGALKTVIKQNLHYHAYCEMLYSDSLPEAMQKYRELVSKLMPCLPENWKSYEDVIPGTGILKQFATSQSNASPSVYVEILKNPEGSASLYTVQVRFLALN